MQKRIICVLLSILFYSEGFSEIDPSRAQYFGAEDLHLSGKKLTSFETAPGEHILVFDKGFNLVLGDNKLKSEQAVVWLKSTASEHLGVENSEYKLTVYLQDKVAMNQGKGSKMSGLEVENKVIEDAQSLVARFEVNGEIFITADQRATQDPRTDDLYRNAQIAIGQIKAEPEKAVAETEQETEQTTNQKSIHQAKVTGQESKTKAADVQEAPKLNVIDKMFGSKSKDKKKVKAARTSRQSTKKVVKTATAEIKTIPVPPPPPPKINYPVNITSATETPVKISNENLPDGSGIATILDRFYLWQKQDESGNVLEFMADSAVIFYARKADEPNAADGLLADNSVKAIYVRGDVIMTEGERTIRAYEAYYDFQKKQALIIKPVLQTYDPSRGIPIFVRADKIRQVSEGKFAGENVTLTSSEFYVPQVSATASKVFITDTMNVQKAGEQPDKTNYDIEMRDVKFKVNNRSVFYWPKIRTNTERPDIPLRRIQVGRDSSFGTSLETEWYLARVLGLREPKGVESRLMIDHYSKRGTGAGADIEYKREKYFGNINGYIINDSGEDDLGRERQNIEPPDQLRGMLNFQHRHFLPEHWQLTLESSYISDEFFLEAFNREDFFEGRGQETSAHLKWIKDNQAFAILGRWRINNFADQLEDLPSAQYHLTGKSLWDDKLTLYSDSMAGRFRQRVGNDHDTLNITDEYFTFGSHRTELDFPLQYKTGNIVPYMAGTFGYNDRGGFSRGIATGINNDAGDSEVFIGEVGLRTSTQYWKQYNYKSKFWDVNGVRHIVKPFANAALFSESSSFVEQKDTYTLGVLQRWQTKRGQGDKRRTVDWMRFNLEYTGVSNDSDLRRADRQIWNNPFIPLSTMSAPGIFNSDLGAQYRRFELFGPQRDSVNGDYIWRLSDTTAVLSDFNWDVEDAEFEQFNVGISRMVWPNLSLFIGSRYMRSVTVDNKQGSTAFTFAATYKINPRYTLSFAHQYDFNRDGLIANEVSIIRRYHRLYYALSYRTDESLDRRSIVLTIWPEGVGELAFGSRSVMGFQNPGDRNY
ncbi:MAG: LPS-assembly protein LptD [Planctomycetes bacterium ADurb.Bin401]|nr:MAG: LPS-assembly protein LptD [Planctomycetes bacterium ADurb.Bin401]